VRERALGAANERDPSLLAVPPPIARDQAETRFGNVIDLMGRATQDRDAHEIISALLAIGIAHSPQDLSDARSLTVPQLVWLAANTSFNAFGALETILDERTVSQLYRTVAEIAVGSLRPSGFGRPEALTAAVLLVQSGTEAAAVAASNAAEATADPMIRAMLGQSGHHTATLRGELAPAPRGFALTLLMAVTLLLLVLHVGRLIGRWLLGYKRPAEVRLTPEGLAVSWRTELLGRSLRERSALVPTSALARITREVRYARSGLYAGLAALVVGTFLGVSLLFDGLRVPGGSGPLLLLGTLCLLGGIALDFALSSLSDTLRGSCRLIVVPRRGGAICLRSLNPRATDAVLESLAREIGRSRVPIGSAS
jgi:hypothetical protein